MDSETNGILIIDKPEGFTSHDVVGRVRRILKTKRVGHTGTLDPFATGILVVLVGKATRLAQFLDKDEKEYEAIIRFGWATDTGDRTGARIGEYGMQNEEVAEIVSVADWEQLLGRFRGEIEQTPPMYSAKKIEGKKLYELARQGIEVERKPVSVTINKLEIIDPGKSLIDRSGARIRVVCSAGTYIRTLAEDIGGALGTGAHLEQLRRTRAGKFELSRSIELEKLAELDEPSAALLPMTEAISHLPKLVLSPERVAKTRDGLSSRFGEAAENGQPIQMLDQKGEIVAVGSYELAEKSVRPRVVLI